MALRFTACRSIASIDDLTTEIEKAQLRHAGKLWDGEDRPIEERLEVGGPDEAEGSFAGFCDLWKVVDGDQHVYDAWFYIVDSGTVFRAGTTEDVAVVIQFGLECSDPAIRAQLGPAMVEAELLPPGDTAYAEFKALLDQQQP
jgi:hypothetical protein